MADIEFFEDDEGDNYVIPLYNKDGTPVDLSGYTEAQLLIKTIDKVTTKLEADVTILSSNPGKINWPMAEGEQNFSGDFVAQIVCTGSGKEKKSYFLTVKAYAKL